MSILNRKSALKISSASLVLAIGLSLGTTQTAYADDCLTINGGALVFPAAVPTPSSGADRLACGPNSTASAVLTTAVGPNSTANVTGATALGANATSGGINGVAVGQAAN